MYFKVTNFSVPAGVSHWRVEADLISAKIGSGDAFTLSVWAGADAAGTGSTSLKKGIEAENQDGKALDDIKPGSLVNEAV